MDESKVQPESATHTDILYSPGYQEPKKLDGEHVKVDKHGHPLVPQPSDNKDDPLVRTDDYGENLSRAY